MKTHLKKLVIKNSNELINSFLAKEKMAALVGGSGYCAQPGLACYGFCPTDGWA
ncbi:hypothetical protein FACS189434_02960 [Bacteroidia bacterium]|nr:hypothetical protein FACS189434_02960 [Bacteroidia bacterium]